MGDALRITGELNGGYQEPKRVRELLAQLTGKPVDETVTLFPPFNSDFGKNITLGKRIFINSGCKFQDQGGVTGKTPFDARFQLRSAATAVNGVLARP